MCSLFLSCWRLRGSLFDILKVSIGAPGVDILKVSIGAPGIKVFPGPDFTLIAGSKNYFFCLVRRVRRCALCSCLVGGSAAASLTY